MKKIIVLVALSLAASMGSASVGAEGTSHGNHGSTKASKSSTAAETFSHKASSDGVRVEFQIMSLASMNMKDPGGATHHIMVKFFDEAMNHQIKDVLGKIKVIDPSGKEQIGTLKDYSGIYAANFTFKEKGKYGVMCLFKVKEKKHLIKFWYPHK